MLAELGLPIFETVIHNNKISFLSRWNSCTNSLVAVLRIH